MDSSHIARFAGQALAGEKIAFAHRAPRHKIPLVAITKELLAGSFVREIPK